MRKFLSPIGLLQSAIALLLVIGCLYAAQWQFGRGQSQADTNKIISANLEMQPLAMADLANLDSVANQWRTVNLQGRFSTKHEELVRNRYHEGQFGFEVLTLFTATTGQNFWIDRGWVAAGPNASTPPVVAKPPSDLISINARIRSENLSRQLQGSFFVTRNVAPKPESIAKIQDVDAEPYYLDLLPSADGTITRLTNIELPELSNGPHFAYALQWLAFAVLTVIGRFLLFREAKRLPLV